MLTHAAPAEPATLADLIQATFTSRAAHWAIFHDGEREMRWTIAEIAPLIRRFAGGLRGIGLPGGDVLAVQMPTRLATLIADAACAWSGIVLLPMIHIYDGSELTFILRESQAKALVTPASWRKIDFAARRDNLRSAFPDLLHIVEGASVDGSGVLFDRLLKSPEFDVTAPVPTDIAALVYTSGTTSRPKGVQHSHAGMAAELLAARGRDFTSLSPWPTGTYRGDPRAPTLLDATTDLVETGPNHHSIFTRRGTDAAFAGR